jgi:hypothetical protein
MEPKGSLPQSHLLAACPYPEPARSNPQPRSNFLKIHLNIILPSTPWSIFIHLTVLQYRNQVRRGNDVGSKGRASQLRLRTLPPHYTTKDILIPEWVGRGKSSSRQDMIERLLFDFSFMYLNGRFSG